MWNILGACWPCDNLGVSTMFTSHQQNCVWAPSAFGIMCSEKGCTWFSSVWYIHCRPWPGTMKPVPWLLHCNDTSRGRPLISLKPQLQAGQLRLDISHTLWCNHSCVNRRRISWVFQPWWIHPSEQDFFVRKWHWYRLWREKPFANLLGLMHSLLILFSAYELRPMWLLRFNIPLI